MPFATAPGARLHYEMVGAGTPLVFVHETAADLRSWESQLRWFSRTHLCIAYNARGYPHSDIGEHPASHDHQRLAEDIGAVMDAAGVDKAFVVGLSMGAYVTAQFALKHPQRVLGMVLAGLGTGSDEPDNFRAFTLATAARLRAEGVEHMAQEMARGTNRVQLARKDPRGFAEFMAHLRALDPAGLANILEYCHSTRPPVYAFEAQLRQLHIPTLIAVGDEDTGCLQPALFLKHCLPDAGLWICPRSGHAINLEEPAAFNAAVTTFIQGVQRAV